MPLPLPMRHTAFPPTAGPMQLPVAQPTPSAALNLNPEAIAALLAQFQVLQQLPVGLPAAAVASVPEAMPVIDPTLELTSKIDLLHNRLDDLEKQTAGNKRCHGNLDDDGNDGGDEGDGDREVNARQRKKNKRAKPAKHLLNIPCERLNSAQMKVRGELGVMYSLRVAQHF
jgi:hypothetical protein